MTRKKGLLKLSLVFIGGSLLLFLTSLSLQDQLQKVYEFEFSPQNFLTDAVVDEEVETIEFQTLDQWVEIPIEAGGFHLLEIMTSGGVFTDDPYQEGVPTFRLFIDQSLHHVQTNSLITTMSYRWFQPKPSLIRISFTNFVKISEGTVHTIIIQNIYLYR
jgi:hypothetical protein